MNITKNDVDIINNFNADLSMIKHHYFTHELKVKHDVFSDNNDCKKINDLIEKHFNLIDDDYLLNDLYKISKGWNDIDQECGAMIEYSIDDIEYKKTKIINDNVIVFFNLKLSNKNHFVF